MTVDVVMVTCRVVVAAPACSSRTPPPSPPTLVVGRGGHRVLTTPPLTATATSGRPPAEAEEPWGREQVVLTMASMLVAVGAAVVMVVVTDALKMAVIGTMLMADGLPPRMSMALGVIFVVDAVLLLWMLVARVAPMAMTMSMTAALPGVPMMMDVVGASASSSRAPLTIVDGTAQRGTPQGARGLEEDERRWISCNLKRLSITHLIDTSLVDRRACGRLPCHFLSRPLRAGRIPSGSRPRGLARSHFIRRAHRGGPTCGAGEVAEATSPILQSVPP